jgi:hypothetical protein
MLISGDGSGASRVSGAWATVKLSGRSGTRSAGSEETVYSASWEGMTAKSIEDVSARAWGWEEVVKVCIRGTVRVREGIG